MPAHVPDKKRHAAPTAGILEAVSRAHAVTDTMSWVANFASVGETHPRCVKSIPLLGTQHSTALSRSHCELLLRISCQLLQNPPSLLTHPSGNRIILFKQPSKGGVLSTDNDECATGRHGCSHRCINYPGTYQCVCPFGYQLMQNQQTCRGEMHIGL